MTSVGLIPRNRLARIPREQRLAHEYCYFLHDECVRLLVEYEAAKANTVTVKFRNRAEADAYARLSKGKRGKKGNPIEALVGTGYHAQARRVELNTITMAMVSDCLLHIFEALRCMERRKTVVALNLLRKPLTDSLMYLSWMLGDEDAFYAAFSTGVPEELTQNKLGNIRAKVLGDAIAKTELEGIITADFLQRQLFDPKQPDGLYGLFQHAVHLITMQRVELRTSPQNFNFIFKSPVDDDIYETLYAVLPIILLFVTHVVVELFQRLKPMDPGARVAFGVRTTFGYYLNATPELQEITRKLLSDATNGHVFCDACDLPTKVTLHNARRMVLTESLRCTGCGCKGGFPFSWLF